MGTVRDLIKGSLRLIGAVATGETPSADEQSDALSALNDMLDSWSTNKLIVYGITKEKFSLVSGTGSYTIGSSGTFNTSRPMKLETATIEDQTNSPYIEFPLQIMSEEQWAEIRVKDMLSTVPTKIFLNDDFPLSTVYLWPAPGAANKLVLYSWKPITSFAAVTTSISFPPGYSRALRYNLAVELAPEYGKSVAPEIAAVASESKANIKRMNIKPHFLYCDGDSISKNRFNILNGE